MLFERSADADFGLAGEGVTVEVEGVRDSFWGVTKAKNSGLHRGVTIRSRKASFEMVLQITFTILRTKVAFGLL